MKLGVLCSGGKDSLFACWKAMQHETVSCLISVISANEDSYMFHTPNIRLTRLQAEAAGLPLVEIETAGEKEEELADLEDAIRRSVEAYGIEGIVTGAILSVYQASRVQRICRELGLWCFNPLWHTDQDAYMEELIGAGFEVLIAGVFSAPFDESWLGRRMDHAMLAELRSIAEKWHITLTGEGGELETFVADAPFFSRAITVTRAHTAYRNHNGRYLIDQAELTAK
ncbi:MAG: diphthine--ammonia ligase [Methanomicrobiales archaeon]|nr:diphthine--ammonia ligase [Methanomicrobiales archaeon]